MNKKEYLNEEKYINTNSKLKTIAILIFTITVIIGGTLIFNSIKKNNYYNSSEGINARLEIDKQIGKLEEEQSEELHKNSKSDKYYEIEYKIKDLKKQKEDFEPILVVFIPIGASIIILGFIFSGWFFTVANMRKIQAYQMQQVVPVAQEIAEKMAPTAGVVAKEVVKGIKKGLKDEEE